MVPISPHVACREAGYGDEGKRVPEEGWCSSFPSLPLSFPGNRVYYLNLAVLAMFALNHHGWRNAAHPLHFCNAGSWEKALVGSWYSSQASRSFIHPSNGKLQRCLSVMLQAILAHSINIATRQQDFRMLTADVEMFFPQSMAGSSCSVLSQAVHGQCFQSAITQDSQGPQSLLPTDCISYSAQEKNKRL